MSAAEPYRALIGTADVAISTQAAALVAEDRELELVGAAQDGMAVASALEGGGIDTVLLHEDLGPLPIMDLVRDLVARFPQVGVVIAVRDGGTELLRAALQAGARDVIELPLTLEEIEVGLKGAARWSRAVRTPIEPDEESTRPEGTGKVIALAGAKGGVGTTTLALHVALAAAGSSRAPAVCLLDLDLQGGDAGVFLDVSHHRSSLDLVDIEELSTQQIESVVYLHPSGLRVLLGPAEGERGEEVGAVVTRRMLGAMKSAYDVTVVDVGAVVTEGGAAAVEIADEVLVVVTPDVPAVRAANRLVALWRRLGVRPSEPKAVVNRADRGNDVQPDLMRKVLELPLAVTPIPAAFRHLEPAGNTGLPERVTDEGLRKAFSGLATELGLLGPARARPRISLRAEAGQVAAEAAGMAGIVMMIALLLWQAVLAGYTFVLAGHAAREGARQFAVGEPAEAAAREDLPKAWREGMRVKQGDRYVDVSLAVPALVPGLDTPARVETRAGTIVEEGRVP